MFQSAYQLTILEASKHVFARHQIAPKFSTAENNVMKRVFTSIAACCVATFSFAQDAPERTPVAEFKKNGFSLEQVEEYRSNYNLPNLLTGDDASVWFSQRTSEVMYTAHLPVKVPYMPLGESIMPEIGDVTAQTKNFGTLTLNEFLVHPEIYVKEITVIHKGEVVFEDYPGLNPWLKC